MLVSLESFVSLAFIGDFGLVNSICYSRALLGVLKCCNQSNHKQVAFNVFALLMFLNICMCSKDISVALLKRSFLWVKCQEFNLEEIECCRGTVVDQWWKILNS